jgi:Flp pilus assembly protein TadG
MPHNGRRNSDRHGTVSVEVALTLPILLLFMFGAIEFSRMNMLRNTAENASYEGARHAALPGATKQKVKAAAQNVLDLLSVKNATINVNPGNITNSTEEVQVKVSIPIADNTWILPMFSADKVIVKKIRLTRERTTGSGDDS